MKKTLLAVSLSFAFVATSACSEEKKMETPAPPPAAATPTAPAPSAPATPAAAPAGDKIGVAECEEYIAAWEKCYEKMPEAAKTAAKSSFEMQRKAWKDQAAALEQNPQAKAALASACKQAIQALQQTCK